MPNVTSSFPILLSVPGDSHPRCLPLHTLHTFPTIHTPCIARYNLAQPEALCRDSCRSSQSSSSPSPPPPPPIPGPPPNRLELLSIFLNSITPSTSSSPAGRSEKVPLPQVPTRSSATSNSPTSPLPNTTTASSSPATPVPAESSPSAAAAATNSSGAWPAKPPPNPASPSLPAKASEKTQPRN